MSGTPKRRAEKLAPDGRCDGSQTEKEQTPRSPEIPPQEMKNPRRKGGRRPPPQDLPDGRNERKGGRTAAR